MADEERERENENAYNFWLEILRPGIYAHKWFKNLNWQSGFTEEELKNEYHKLVKLHHPDSNPEGKSSDTEEIIIGYNFAKFKIKAESIVLRDKKVVDLMSSIDEAIRTMTSSVYSDIQFDEDFLDLNVFENINFKHSIDETKPLRLSNSTKNNFVMKQIYLELTVLRRIIFAYLKAIDEYIARGDNQGIINYIYQSIDQLTQGDNSIPRVTNKYYRSEKEYYGAYRKTRPSVLGPLRDRMRKSRNVVCHSLLDALHKVNDLVTVINRGLIEFPIPDPNDGVIINTFYQDIDNNYFKYLKLLQGADNYYCYLNDEQKILKRKM